MKSRVGDRSPGIRFYFSLAILLPGQRPGTWNWRSSLAPDATGQAGPSQPWIRADILHASLNGKVTSGEEHANFRFFPPGTALTSCIQVS